MKKPNPYQEANSVRVFNKYNPVGTFVSVLRDHGERLTTTTTSEAWLLGGHTAVVMLRGISGCYALRRVTPIVA